MSDVLHREVLTPTVADIASRRAAFRAKIAEQATARIIPIKQAEPVAVPVPVRAEPRVTWVDPMTEAFGPIVYPKRVRPTIAAIVAATAKFYCLPEDEILSKRRNNYLVTPRHVAMYLADAHTIQTRRDIERAIGKRDHSTVHHGVNSIHGRVLFDDAEILCAIDGIVADLSSKFTVNA